MRGSRRRWWIVYGACVAVVLAALGWISHVLLALEDAENRARAETARQAVMHDALWRMDSWLAPLLAQEAARPYYEYRAYYPEERAYSNMLQRLDSADVLTRSPLLTFESEIFRLHFQVAPDGTITSPQAPEGNERDLAVSTCISMDTVGQNGAVLARVDDLVEPAGLRAELARLEPRLQAALAEEEQLARQQTAQIETTAKQSDVQQLEVDQNRQRSLKKLKTTYGAKNAAPDWQEGALTKTQTAGVQVGALIPLWLGTGEARELCFVRRVRTGAGDVLQGVLADWPNLRAKLIEQASDLLPDAVLEPVSADALTDDASGRVLATVPVALAVTALRVPPSGPWTPGRAALCATWLAVLAAMAAVAVTLQKNIDYADRRTRFASTVTHELRTPLTTFRMYSEMLADGMVTNERKRDEYLRTMQAEAGRLSVLVENVLAYARLEDGRARGRLEDVTFDELVTRVSPPLERRVSTAERPLETRVEGDPEAALRVDVEAVGQILFNLVDNACKYGASREHPALAVTYALSGERLRFTVRDHGGGVPAGVRRAIFEPFDRGGRTEADASPGVGLGLALSRGLARDLGGDLTLEASDGGACFVLDLPGRA